MEQECSTLSEKYIDRFEQAKSCWEGAITQGLRGSDRPDGHPEEDSPPAPGQWMSLLTQAFGSGNHPLGTGPRIGEWRSREDDGENPGGALKCLLEISEL